MKKRKIIISVSGIVVIVLAVLFVIFILGGEEQQEESEAVKKAVNSQEITNDTIRASLKITGRVIPSESVNLFAEVGGISSFGSTPFKTGESFRKGQLLLKIDNSEFENAIIASKSQFKSLIAQALPDIKLDYESEYPSWKKYLANFKIDQPIKRLPDTENDQLSLFLSGRNIYSNYYSIKEQEERLSKYEIRAPFYGALTETYIDQSTLVRVGQQLGEFISKGRFELESSIQYDELDLLEIGQEVEFSDLDKKRTYKGRLLRINDKVNSQTQLVKIFFEIIDDNLKAGAFLEGNLQSAVYINATRIPGAAIVEENQVYVIEDGVAKLRTVDVMEYSPNEAIISGLKDGTKIITNNKNSAFEGSQVIEIQ